MFTCFLKTRLVKYHIHHVLYITWNRQSYIYHDWRAKKWMHIECLKALAIQTLALKPCHSEHFQGSVFVKILSHKHLKNVVSSCFSVFPPTRHCTTNQISSQGSKIYFPANLVIFCFAIHPFDNDVIWSGILARSHESWANQLA